VVILLHVLVLHGHPQRGIQQKKVKNKIMATCVIICKGGVKNINTKISKRIRKLNKMYIIIVIT